MDGPIQDYFLPAYIRRTLEDAGKFHLSSTTMAGLPVEHLEVDPDLLRIVRDALARRQQELLARDGPTPQDHFVGLRRLAAQITQPGSDLQREALQVLPIICDLSPEMIQIMLRSFADMVASGEDATVPYLPPNAAALAFVEHNGGYARYYPGPLGLSFPGLLALDPRRRTEPVVPLPVAGFPRVVSNVAAGNVPGGALIEAFLALLVGAASLGKNASDEPYLGPRLLRELAAVESRDKLFPLSDLVALVTFGHDDQASLEELIHCGDHVQATGGLESKRSLAGLVWRMRFRGLRDLKRRISGHWHKVSFDVVAREYLSPEWIDIVAANVAFDNSMLNTQGCLSAQQVWVEGDRDQVMAFANRYIVAMRDLLARLPKGSHPHEGLREMYERYEGSGESTVLTRLRDIQQAPFFVAYDDAPQDLPLFNAANRSIIIRRVGCLEKELPRFLGRGKRADLLQSCGVAVPPERLIPLAEALGRCGVNRIVAAGNIWDMRLQGESWDGYMPPTDLVAPQAGYWTTISFRDPNDALRRAWARNQALLDDNPTRVSEAGHHAAQPAT